MVIYRGDLADFNQAPGQVQAAMSAAQAPAPADSGIRCLSSAAVTGKFCSSCGALAESQPRVLLKLRGESGQAVLPCL